VYVRIVIIIVRIIIPDLKSKYANWPTLKLLCFKVNFLKYYKVSSHLPQRQF
jgi:hypothetical protein